jgi:ATP-dependent DNA helicase RecG
VQLRDDHVRVSNPGGFVEGVGPDNLLVTEPRPRNPRLADAFKRAGLVERTGRGVETIYRGQLRNGRQPPDYALSTAASVSVLLDSGPADLDFVQVTVQAGRRLGQALGVDELLALWQAQRQGETTAPSLAAALQRDVASATNVLAGLAQAGLLRADGVIYHLAVNHSSFANENSESIILAHVRQQGRISRQEVMEQCQVSARQATYLLRKLVAQGLLVRQGTGRGTVYTWPETNKTNK